MKKGDSDITWHWTPRKGFGGGGEYILFAQFIFYCYLSTDGGGGGWTYYALQNSEYEKKKKHRNKILRNIHARKGKNSIRHFDYERNTKRIVKLIFFITTECIKRIILHDRYFTSGEIIYTNQHGGHNINRTYRKTRIVAKIQNITFARADHYPNSPPPVYTSRWRWKRL